MAEEVKSKPSFVDELLWGLRLKPLPTEKELTASKPVVSTKPKDVKISPSLTDELLYGLRLKNLPTEVKTPEVVSKPTAPKENESFSQADVEEPVAVVGLPEVVAQAPPSLGGGIYEYLVNKGAQSLASFAARKKLAEQWGINNYTGTAEQNALLQSMFEHQFALAEMSNNTSGLRKGIDY